MRVDHWPRAGRVVYDLLVGDVDEPDPDFGLRPRWQWRWMTRWSEIELVDQTRVSPSAPTPSVELWRVRWKPWRHDEEVAYLTETSLAFPALRSGVALTPVTFYRACSFRDLGVARRDFELMSRSVRQALRPLT